MFNANTHVPHDELLLAAEGELSPQRAAQVRGHLDACGTCRARLEELKRTAADVFRAYRSELDPELPSATGPRAALRAQMAELSAGSRRSSWLARIPQMIERRRWVYVCALLLVTALGIQALHREIQPNRSVAAEFASGPLVPNARLTPGAARSISIGQVCMLQSPAETAQIPADVQKMVFHEYGMDGAPARNYEVDHLITPALGGTDDIRNLWPEPYSSTVWNAHVKDELENRLHELVCDGKLDLPTAQRDIATNWISAYQKYFHTYKPLPNNSLLVPRKVHTRLG
jgi:hypothetical protein